MLTSDEVVRDEFFAYARICQANIETSLANLPLFMSPRVENVQALILGVSSQPVHPPLLDHSGAMSYSLI